MVKYRTIKLSLKSADIVTSTVAGQIPGYGTAAALALDGVNALLNVGDGKPKEPEKEAPAEWREEKEKHRRVYARNAQTSRSRSSADRGLRLAERGGSIQQHAELEIQALNEERS